MPYFTLVTRNPAGLVDPTWRIQFGDKDRDTVIDEMADTYCREHRSRDMRILKTKDARQATIDAAVAKLNAPKSSEIVSPAVEAVAVEGFEVIDAHATLDADTLAMADARESLAILEYDCGAVGFPDDAHALRSWIDDKGLTNPRFWCRPAIDVPFTLCALPVSKADAEIWAAPVEAVEAAPAEFVATPNHVAAMRACDAWDALCESNGDDGTPKPPHVVAAIALLDTLNESQLDVVLEAARPFPQRTWVARDSAPTLSERAGLAVEPVTTDNGPSLSPAPVETPMSLALAAMGPDMARLAMATLDSPPAVERGGVQTDSEGREFIDMTPTWAEILPTLLAIVTDGDSTGRAFAREELLRMAGMADRFAAARKAFAGMAS